jgi:hypothetical protein
VGEGSAVGEAGAAVAGVKTVAVEVGAGAEVGAASGGWATSVGASLLLSPVQPATMIKITTPASQLRRLFRRLICFLSSLYKLMMNNDVILII